MSVQLTAEKRTELSRSSLRQLREEGRIPGVVYGNQMTSQLVHVDAKQFAKIVGKGRSEFFDLQIQGGDTIPALIKEVQQKNGKIGHVDFQHVSKNKPMRVKVPIHYSGTAKGTKTGGVLQTQATELEVEALPDNLPSGFEVDVTSLEVGHKLTAADVTLPEGVTLISSEEELLATIVQTRGADGDTEEEEVATEASTDTATDEDNA